MAALNGIEILLIEDSPGDVRLTVDTFREAKPSARVHVVSDGVEAMAFLRREGRYIGASRPDLIVLDLNLPKMNGHEVLALIKQDPDLRRIPTIILSISTSGADIDKCYELQANCYLGKPLHLEAFEDLLRAITDFWPKPDLAAIPDPSAPP